MLISEDHYEYSCVGHFEMMKVSVN